MFHRGSRENTRTIRSVYQQFPLSGDVYCAPRAIGLPCDGLAERHARASIPVDRPFVRASLDESQQTSGPGLGKMSPDERARVDIMETSHSIGTIRPPHVDSDPDDHGLTRELSQETGDLASSDQTSFGHFRLAPSITSAAERPASRVIRGTRDSSHAGLNAKEAATARGADSQREPPLPRPTVWDVAVIRSGPSTNPSPARSWVDDTSP